MHIDYMYMFLMQCQKYQNSKKNYSEKFFFSRKTSKFLILVAWNLLHSAEICHSIVSHFEWKIFNLSQKFYHALAKIFFEFFPINSSEIKKNTFRNKKKCCGISKFIERKFSKIFGFNLKTPLANIYKKRGVIFPVLFLDQKTSHKKMHHSVTTLLTKTPKFSYFSVFSKVANLYNSVLEAANLRFFQHPITSPIIR